MPKTEEKKKKRNICFYHFRYFEGGVTREIPKTDQRFSFRDNRDEMFTTDG